jgi:hypothetical protein
MVEHDEGVIHRHEKTFDSLELRIREQERCMATLKAEHKTVMTDVYGGSQPGIRDTILLFKREVETRDEERKNMLEKQQNDTKEALDNHYAKSNFHMNLIGVVAAVILAITAVAGFTLSQEVKVNNDMTNHLVDTLNKLQNTGK